MRSSGASATRAVSWQEASQDLMSALATRNVIMYTVVSAVLIVAAFGIYNVISTVVLEKQRDIAILKSVGFRARDIRRIFVVQGMLLGIAGSAAGLAAWRSADVPGLMQIRLKYPGSTDPVPLPIDWNWRQFAIAGAFAMGAALLAAVLPARKGSARSAGRHPARRAMTDIAGTKRSMSSRESLPARSSTTLVSDASLAVQARRIRRDHRCLRLRQVVAVVPVGPPRPTDRRHGPVARAGHGGAR